MQVSQVGYHPAQKKVAICELDRRDNSEGQAVLLRLGETGEEVVKTLEPKKWGKFLRYNYLRFDFTDVTAPGLYKVRYGASESSLFRIAEDVYDRGVWQPVLEYFLKNDELHDPFVNDDDLVALDVCTREDLAEIAPLARRINEALIEIFAKIDVKLVDFKIEMGRTSDGTLLLADEITPDSCRLWDQRDHSGKVEHLDKDLFRRDLGDIIPAYEEIESRLAELAKSEGIEVAE